MSKLSDLFKGSSEPIQEIEPGFYTSHDLMHGETPYRLHLRVESNHQGVLTLNASTVLHLNKTAMEMAYFLIQSQKPAEIAKSISNRYNAPKKDIKADVDGFYETLMSFVDQEDLAPTGVFGALAKIEDNEIIAPYRLDCYFTAKDNGARLSTAEWKVVIEKAYNTGIPHIMFLDVPEEEKDALLELLTHVEELGLVSGLLAKPSFLYDSAFFNELLTRGLDHLVLEADPTDPEQRKLLTNILDQDLFTCLRMPFEANTKYETVFAELFDHGLNAYAYRQIPQHLDETLISFEQMLSDHHVPIVDDMPYSLNEEVDLHAYIEDAKPSLKYLRLMPNGDLLIPAQKSIQIGNLLIETWESLWEKCRTFSDG